MKKKILGVALVVCILVLSVASVTMAYFTDTKDMTNTFTVGDVKIELTEGAFTRDNLGNIIKDTSVSVRTQAASQEIAYGKVFPMQTIYKDPIIENTGTESAFVGAVITIENTAGDIADILAVTAGTGKTHVDGFITGLVQDGDDYTVKFVQEVNALKVYIIVTDALDNGDTTTLFTGVKIPNEWNNDQIAKCAGLSIKVEAYATQQAGFADATTALKAAFDVFDNIA